MSVINPHTDITAADAREVTGAMDRAAKEMSARLAASLHPPRDRDRTFSNLEAVGWKRTRLERFLRWLRYLPARLRHSLCCGRCGGEE